MKRKIVTGFLVWAILMSVIPIPRAEAASNYLYIKGNSATAYTTTKKKTIYVGGNSVDFDYKINGKKNTGVSGRWTSSDTKKLKVDKYGVCKGYGNGTATVTYQYVYRGKTYQLKTKVKVRTRAESVSIATTAGEDKEIALRVGKTTALTPTITPRAKARRLNEKIESTYKAYYTLYTSEDCTTEAGSDVVTVSANGLIRAVGAGTVYLRARAKSSATATTYTVDSNVIKITVTAAGTTNEKNPVTTRGVTQTGEGELTITYDSDITSVVVSNQSGAIITHSYGSPAISADKRTAVMTTAAGAALSGFYYVYVNNSQNYMTIYCSPSTLKSITLDSNYGIVEQSASLTTVRVGYSLWDQFGDNITNAGTYALNTIKASAFGITTSPTEPGVLQFRQSGRITNTGISYPIVIISTANGTKVTADLTMTTTSIATAAKIAGIYQYVGEAYDNCIRISEDYYYNKTSNTYFALDDEMMNHIEGKYLKMADSSYCGITPRTVMGAYGGTTASVSTAGAYYLLMKVTDQNGNTISHSGVAAATANLAVIGGTTGLALASTTSLQAIVIDNQKYLAYPLTAATLQSGTAYFGTSNDKLILNLQGSSGISSFAVLNRGIIYADIGGYLDYVVMDGTGNQITTYATLVAMSNALDGGDRAIITDTSIIRSNCNSTFYWEKQFDGSAKLKYTPYSTVLLQNGTRMTVGVDTITTIDKNIYSIVVYAK